MLLCGVAAGCVVRGETAGLEEELRGHEDRILSLEQELRSTRDELEVARREAEHLRTQAAAGGEMVLTSEQSDVLFRAEGLRINTLLTGGLDEDGKPGDEVLSVVLEPFDSGGTTLKLPGDVTIDVTDPAADGEAKAVGTWTYTADEVRETWHAGLLVVGFKFRLEWQQPPGHEKLVVHARLATTDGRTFDATETVKVDVSAEAGTLAATP